MSEKYTSVILSNICVIEDDNGNILVQDRKRKDWPGITFPGGHVEDEEELSETLYREVLEETGIVIEKKEYEPFYQVNRFYKSLDREGINRFKQFNYYIVHTNEKYDLSKRKLDQFEVDKNYELKYIPLDKLLDELDRTMNDNKRNIRVYEDIKDVITYYFEEYK